MTNEEAVSMLHYLAKTIDNLYKLNDDGKEVFEMAIEALKAQESIEPLTDIEQRIFLAAISREEKVCKKVDEELVFPKAENCIDLVPVCRSIERKVKRALWG